MEDATKLAQAKVVYETLCRALDKEEWTYKKDEEKLAVVTSVKGEDLPIDLVFRVDARRSLVSLFSFMSFTVPEDNRLDMAIAVTVLNNIFVNGCFDYDITKGKLIFRMASSFLDSVLGAEAFLYMLYTTCKMVDTYNDQLFMLSKKVITLEQFLGKLKEERK